MADSKITVWFAGFAKSEVRWSLKREEADFDADFLAGSLWSEEVTPEEFEEIKRVCEPCLGPPTPSTPACRYCSQPIHQEGSIWFVGKAAPHALGSDVCEANASGHQPH